jgi:hypothetical protein
MIYNHKVGTNWPDWMGQTYIVLLDFLSLETN